MDNGSRSYLHGDLDLSILEARSLQSIGLFSGKIQRVFAWCGAPFCRRKISSQGKNHDPDKMIITIDPYVTVNIGGVTVACTSMIPNSHNPKWDEHFSIPLAHGVADIEFKVKDGDLHSPDVIGTATVLASEILSGRQIDQWFSIVRDNGELLNPKAAVHLRLRFIPCDTNVGNAEDEHGVRRSYFPARPGGRVTLYQDAHVGENELRRIELENGMEYQQGKCWEDICHAILEAQHLVYIVGWSVYHKVKLVRVSSPGRPPLPNAGDLSLGDLLRYKSQEGVRVLLLVWYDKTSYYSACFINPQGVMQTHGEETRKFFKHSSVICKLSPRYPSSKLGIIRQQVVGTLYTHHQKCVIVDSQAPEGNRKITAFLGGLDLCDGRYDTPGHPLFRHLDDDYYNPSLNGMNINVAPREPWHDLHCKIEGPAAYDVLTNFEQRWRKVIKSSIRRKIKSISPRHDDTLLNISRLSRIISPANCASGSPNDPKLWACEENNPEGWQVQVFRSIDSGSVQGLPKDVKEANTQNLFCDKNLMIDKSIQTAYIEAIRSAQYFIYIENQYFLGSSYAWPTYRNAGADHLIPMELALKITSKIRANERFAVYVVIPMWPEGVPTSASVQEILFWQGETRQMMYNIIAQEIKAMNLQDAHPQDYLNFYCLGNREPLLASTGSGPQSSKNGDGILPSQRYRRFMIYVHAKGMIVDDEYVILGSANINQRSMAGSRDTEIAMGACQPHYTWGRKKRHPFGQIHGYRMSLWEEHLGALDCRYKEAEKLDCIRAVNSIADENWKKFIAEDYSPMQGHLLRYPVKVGKDGKVQPLSGHEEFPDVGGKVLGAANPLPDELTT